MTEAVAALVGVFAGFILQIFSELFASTFLRRLEITAGYSGRGDLFESADKPTRNVAISIKNTGYRTLRSCGVYVTAVRRDGYEIAGSDPFPCVWSRVKRDTIDMPPGIRRPVPLCRIANSSADASRYQNIFLSSEPVPAALQSSLQPGVFEIDLVVTAESISSVALTVKFEIPASGPVAGVSIAKPR